MHAQQHLTLSVVSIHNIFNMSCMTLISEQAATAFGRPCGCSQRRLGSPWWALGQAMLRLSPAGLLTAPGPPLARLTLWRCGLKNVMSLHYMP